jgi:hypothetical protein
MYLQNWVSEFAFGRLNKFDLKMLLVNDRFSQEWNRSSEWLSADRTMTQLFSAKLADQVAVFTLRNRKHQWNLKAHWTLEMFFQIVKTNFSRFLLRHFKQQSIKFFNKNYNMFGFSTDSYSDKINFCTDH